MTKAWKTCLKKAGITERFTPPGLRRTFNDMLQAHVDPVISKALIGHVTDEMREHYSTVRLDEKRAAMASALRLLPGGGESADAGTPANDTAEAEAAKAAK
jgi:integrase